MCENKEAANALFSAVTAKYMCVRMCAREGGRGGMCGQPTCCAVNIINSTGWSSIKVAVKSYTPKVMKLSYLV